MASCHADADERGEYLYLPMTQTQIARAMLRAGVDNYGDMCLRFMESELPEEAAAATPFESESLEGLHDAQESASCGPSTSFMLLR